MILSDFAPLVGDRRQEIVFIGVGMDEVRRARRRRALLRRPKPAAGVPCSLPAPPNPTPPHAPTPSAPPSTRRPPGQDLRAAGQRAADGRRVRALRGKVGLSARPRPPRLAGRAARRDARRPLARRRRQARGGRARGRRGRERRGGGVRPAPSRGARGRRRPDAPLSSLSHSFALCIPLCLSPRAHPLLLPSVCLPLCAKWGVCKYGAQV